MCAPIAIFATAVLEVDVRRTGDELRRDPTYLCSVEKRPRQRQKWAEPRRQSQRRQRPSATRSGWTQRGRGWRWTASAMLVLMTFIGRDVSRRVSAVQFPGDFSRYFYTWHSDASKDWSGRLHCIVSSQQGTDLVRSIVSCCSSESLSRWLLPVPAPQSCCMHPDGATGLMDIDRLVNEENAALDRQTRRMAA
jgi:hypothetical protein